MLSRKFTEHHFQMIESTVACISLLQQDTGEQENPLILCTLLKCILLLYIFLKLFLALNNV